MTDNKYAPSVWATPKFQDLEVPSGQLCQVRMSGIQQLIGAGVLDSADTLTSLVDEKHIKRTQAKSRAPKNGATKPKVEGNTLKTADGENVQVDTKSLLQDPEKLQRVFGLIDKVTEHMVVQPVVKRPVKKDDHGEEVDLPMDERDENVIYTDMIELPDKMFIFQYAVGGDTDLESFRERFQSNVAGVAAE